MLPTFTFSPPSPDAASHDRLSPQPMAAGEPSPDPSFQGARASWRQAALAAESASLHQDNRDCLEQPRLELPAGRLLRHCHRSHELLGRALDGCEFSDRHWVEERAHVLRRAANDAASGAGATARLAACLRELDSLLRLTVHEGAQGRAVRPALGILPERSTPTNLVDALRTRERLTMSLSLEQPDRRPGKALRDQARQQLLTMNEQDLADPQALPRHQATLADAWHRIDAACELDQDPAARLANEAPWRLARYRGDSASSASSASSSPSQRADASAPTAPR